METLVIVLISMIAIITFVAMAMIHKYSLMLTHEMQKKNELQSLCTQMFKENKELKERNVLRVELN
jgi:type II secretory pathway component PulJ